MPIFDIISKTYAVEYSRSGFDYFGINLNSYISKTGEIKKGTTNAHWYQLGISKMLTTPWVSQHTETHHPDTGAQITGVTIPNITEMMDFVRDAHLRMMPHVPLSGWDVAMLSLIHI